MLTKGKLFTLRDTEGIERFREVLKELLTKEGIKQFSASLHTHVRSDKDAFIKASDLAERINQLNGAGVVITDHGVVSSYEDYRAVLEAAGLKTGYGCEVYVGREHLVLIATDDFGKKGLNKIVTKSNYNLQGTTRKPTIEQSELLEMVKEYKGHIICLTACMQGILCDKVLVNKRISEQITKEKQKLVGEAAEVDVASVEAELQSAISKRDTLAKTAEQKFANREKAVAKLQGDAKAEAEIQLSADKKAAVDAASHLDNAKADVERLKKALSETKAQAKAVEAVSEKNRSVNDKIALLKEQVQTKEEIISNVRRTAVEYRNAFGEDCFYVEVQYHGIPEERICFPVVAQIARELNIPLVATNDVHTLTNSKEDLLRRQVLRSLRFGRWEDAQTGDDQLYLKDNYELAEALLQILPLDMVIESLKNIEVIFNRLNVENKTGSHYPKFFDKVRGDVDPCKRLEEEVEKGVLWRFPEGLPQGYRERLDYELGIIESMGYADYHLVVQDFLKFGRLLGYVPKEKLDAIPYTISSLEEFIRENGWHNKGMTIGPGRGSAVGSLVCYVIGITSLDPIKYGLMFERFLNPERVSMPDIDSDIAKSVRPYLIKYVQHKYGEKAVCGIMTTNALGPKGAINIAAKYYGLSGKEALL